MASAQLASPLRAINIKKLSDFASLRDACVGSCEKKNARCEVDVVTSRRAYRMLNVCFRRLNFRIADHLAYIFCPFLI